MPWGNPMINLISALRPSESKSMSQRRLGRFSFARGNRNHALVLWIAAIGLGRDPFEDIKSGSKRLDLPSEEICSPVRCDHR